MSFAYLSISVFLQAGSVPSSWVWTRHLQGFPRACSYVLCDSRNRTGAEASSKNYLLLVFNSVEVLVCSL